MKRVIIIGTGLHPIHLKDCIDIVINDERNSNNKKIKMCCERVGTSAKSATEAINKFLESTKKANFNKSFEVEPSKFISKPKNNFKKR